VSRESVSARSVPEDCPIGRARHAACEVTHSRDGRVKKVSTTQEAGNSFVRHPLGKGKLLAQPDAVEVVEAVLEETVLDDRDPCDRTEDDGDPPVGLPVWTEGWQPRRCDGQSRPSRHLSLSPGVPGWRRPGQPTRTANQEGTALRRRSATSCGPQRLSSGTHPRRPLSNPTKFAISPQV
jgi:hypothetical protein